MDSDLSNLKMVQSGKKVVRYQCCMQYEFKFIIKLSIKNSHCLRAQWNASMLVEPDLAVAELNVTEP